MASEALAWPSPPTLTDNADGSQSYQMGCAFGVAADATTCMGVQWRVPDTVSTPSGGTHAVGLFNDDSNTRLAYKEFTPVPGGNQDVLFDTPVDLNTGITYTVAVYTLHYVFRGASPAGVSTPSGAATAIEGRLEGDNGGAATADTPSGVFSSTYYVSPLIDTTGDAIAPDSLAVALTFGAPSVAQSFAIAPANLTLSLTFGAPSVAQSFTVAPASLTLPPAFGAPSVAAAFEGAVAVGPLALALTFGAPSVRFVKPDEGNWESLLGVLAAARGDAARDREREANPLDCPIHGWPLQRARGKLHCLFGGHTL